MRIFKCNFIDVDLGECICWVEMARGVVIKTKIPMIHLEGLPELLQGDVFYWNLDERIGYIEE